MRISADMRKIGRVLHEDDDFVTMEIAKRDDVEFHLQTNDDGVTVGGDRFLTVLFAKSDGEGGMEIWDPLGGDG